MRRPLALLLALASGFALAEPGDTAPARAGFERQEIRAQLLPRQFTTLAAEIGAKVKKLPVPEGGAFKAGQTLVSFDCSVQQAMLQKARAELSAADATDKANRRLAELNSVGQLEVDLGRAGRQKAVAEVGAQQAVLDKCNIAAPFAGRIAEQKVREQQFVQPGQPLLDILDDSVLELEFLVPSAWLVWLRSGQRFEVEIDETGQRYPARFERIGARVDPVSQSVKVAAAIDGRFPELIAGMSGRVHIAPPAP
ncbi:efflux RND transporter periplasmic adaptor subunit [Pseudomonadota bacterium DY0742]|jgi:RND family efflux transporter MFP subunit|uniref:efflux RND transporter periplasmic adaptor subunit n=1 Tax=Stutzerimonas balearica TaxID=74829 RepID=UPI001BC9696F|nr:efflux RND transporter periplasmic adaptor subunit [Stutzerimonas balearica]MBS4149917.1 efflux RND transporter periplasmic adaptor subunit [Stutzerimonas balearica]